MIALTIALALLAFAQEPPTEVTPIAELASRPELINQTLTVEGRTFQNPDFTKDVGLTSFQFERSPVKFRLPPRLALPPGTKLPAARVKGFLSKEGNSLVFNVLEFQALLGDEDRLRRIVSRANPRNIAIREKWAKWAESRAAEYNDAALLTAARSVMGETIRIRAEQKENQAPERQLELAELAHSRQVPPPEPAALAHGGFRAALKGAESATDAQKLADRALAFFPEAHGAVEAPTDFASWTAKYAERPAATYREAPQPVRAALDRLLVADVVQHALDVRAAACPADGISLAAEAEKLLPDRPKVAERLLQEGLAASDVTTLRLAEVRERANLYEKQGAPELAKNLLKRWLEDQREHRLSATDAEGRVLLAAQYEELIDDKATAIALLQEAWKIDSQSRELKDAFQRRGYRFLDGAWKPPAAKTASSSDTEAPARIGSDRLEGKTREEVLAAMGGKPNRITRIATQGQVVEQWIYFGGAGGPNRYVSFLVRPGQARPTAFSDGTLRP